MKNMTISAFILAAGIGKRLYPFTKDIPKPMLPLVNKPIIHHSIERLLKAKFKDIGIIIPQDDSIISSSVLEVFPDLNVIFITQNHALGTAHAVIHIEGNLSSEHFVVIAGDSLFSSSFLVELKNTHLKEKNAITLSLEKMEFPLMKNSSTVDYKNGRVWGIREKPQTENEILSDLNSSALYVFSDTIFDMLKDIKKSNRNEYELASAINKTIVLGYRVGGVITERVCHISNSYDLWRFNIQFLNDTHKDKVLGNIIGKNVKFGDSVHLYNSIIGDNSVLLDGITLKSSVVLPNSIVDRDYTNSIIKLDYFESFSS